MASKSRVALIFCTIWLCWTSSTSTCTRVWGGQRQRLQWNIGLSTKSWSEWWSFVRQRDNWRLGAGKTGTHCGRNIAVVIMWVYSFSHTRNICGGHKKCFWKSSETLLALCQREWQRAQRAKCHRSLSGDWCVLYMQTMDVGDGVDIGSNS